MNFRLVLKQLGLVLIVLSACMVISEIAMLLMGPESVAGVHAERYARWALLLAAGIGIVVGGGLWLAFRKTHTHLGRREALLLVAMSWLLGATIAALPFFLWWRLWPDVPADQPFGNWLNCYFEAMSGLTTTGATVLSDIESAPPSLLFWRALTHWLGGLGIVLLFVAVLPSLGVGGKRLFRVEAPGPEPEGVRPHIRDTARILWFIYLGLTLIEILALKVIGSMSWYDSFCHTFATLATGGFSTRNASVGAYSGTVSIIIIIFMVLAGANFGLYFQLMRKRWKAVINDVELRVYLCILLLGSLAVIVSIYHSGSIALTTGQQADATLGNAVREGAFTAVAIQTTTGFCTSDFNTWPFLAQGALIMLMFVGGCAGSTGGGIKVIRIWIAFKVMIAELERAFRPNVVRPVRVGGTTIDTDLKLGTMVYVVGIVTLFVVGTGLIMLIEQAYGDGTCDFTTAATSSIATLCTIGPGLGRIGAIENYGWFCDGSKIVLCIWMALGRLEVFAIAILFTPRFWRGD